MLFFVCLVYLSLAMHCLQYNHPETEIRHCSLILCIHFQLLLGESECDINEQTGQCEHHPEDSAEGESDRKEDEGEEEEEWKSGERRYFRVPNNSSVDTCPLEPEHKTCLLVRFYVLWVTVVFSLVWICGVNCLLQVLSQ